MGIVAGYCPAFLHSFKTVDRLDPFAILQNAPREIFPMSIEMAHVVLEQWNTCIAYPNVSRCTDMAVGMCKVRGMFSGRPDPHTRGYVEYRGTI